MTDHQISMLLIRLSIKSLTLEKLTEAVREVTDSVTVLEAARILGVCKQNVETRKLRGKYKHWHMCECGRCIMIPRNELESNK